MPRKKDNTREEYMKIFSERLSAIIEESGLTKRTVGLDLGITPQAVSAYCSAVSMPDVTTIARIANYFSVSVDYLLGQPDVRTENVWAISEYTGLSAKNVEVLNRLNNGGCNERMVISFLNRVVSVACETMGV